MAESKRYWPALGASLWLLGAVGLAYASRVGHWSAGTTVLVGSAWLLALIVVAREPLRHLFGPVFAHEIQRIGRRRTTFALRFLYVLVIVGLLALLYAAWMAKTLRYGFTGTVRPSELAGFANTFFEAFAGVQFTVAFLLTPAYVAACITDEKERQTLEFLLATDLKNREIIFGKLAARIANLLMYVLAGMPVLAFLQLFGGIDPELALSAAAATATTVIGLAALSVLCSTLCKKSRDAIAISYALAFVYLLVSAAVGLLGQAGLRWYGNLFTIAGASFDSADLTGWFADGNLIFSVLLRTRGGKDLSDDVVAGILRDYVLFWGVASIAMIGFAVIRLRVIALAQNSGGSKRIAGTGPQRTEMGNDPVLWREVFTGHRRAGCAGWFFRLVIVLLLVAIPVLIGFEMFGRSSNWRGNATFAERWVDFREGMTIWVRVATGFLSLLIFFGAALRGAASISGERDRDTWISLIAAPLHPWEVLRGKFLGAVLGMRFCYAMLIVVWVIGLAIGSIHILSLPLAILHIALYTSAFALLGMFCSVTARTTLIASIRAFGAAFFFAGGFWLLLLLCCALPLSFGVGASDRTWDLFGQGMLGFTPPFVAGFWPMDKLSEDNLGPFSWKRHYTPGPIAPFLGFCAWVGFTAMLAAGVYRRLTVAMNRRSKDYKQVGRPSRKLG